MNNDIIENILKDVANTCDVSYGTVAQSLRVAICSSMVGSPILDMVDIIGIDNTIKRIDNVLNKF